MQCSPPSDRFMKILVKTFHNLEEVLAQEIDALGGKNIQLLKRAVMFEGDLEQLYKANLCLRTALRILVPIDSFYVFNAEDLYREIGRIDWSEYMQADQTFAIDSILNSRNFQHSNFVSLKTKDAIVDQFRAKSGTRPSVDTKNPDLRINVHMAGDKCTLSLDASGDSLHRRAYRDDGNKAPLNEVAAAGLVLASGWDRKSTFLDPMCGSGTILIEAAMIAMNRAPGMLRESYGFMKWKNFESKLWEKVLQNAKDGERELEADIYGADISPTAIRIAEENISNAELSDYIRLKSKDFERLDPPDTEPGIIVTNPPYEERLKTGDIIGFYKMIGDTLKQKYAGYEAWVFSGNKEAIKRLGLRASKKLTFFNGSIECKFHKFELFQGSKKHSPNPVTS